MPQCGIARRAKRPAGYQPKRGLATAVARTTIEVAGLRPSKPPTRFIDRQGRMPLAAAPQAVEKARLRRSFPPRVAPFAYSLRLGFIGARSTAVLRACKTSRLRGANCLRQLCPPGTRFPPPHRAANGVRKPCYARLPAPPRMSLGPDYTWRLTEGSGGPVGHCPKGKATRRISTETRAGHGSGQNDD